MVDIRAQSDDKTSQNVKASQNKDTSDDKGGGVDRQERLSPAENVEKCQSQSTRSLNKNNLKF
jgi:hypothetical protein